ncbi:type II secretion system F family protein [Bacillus salacetis]|uniref:type II secretion system F family protein n=1 Tax=Bacillus salacetis TaxID=2315464 RepID=UPI003BA24BAA
MEKLMWIFLIFILASCVFFVLASRISRKKRISERASYFIPVAADTEKSVEAKQKKRASNKVIETTAKLFHGVRFSEKTEIMLVQAGSTLKVEEFFVYRLICSVVAAFLSILLDLGVLISIGALVVGYLVPQLYMKNKRKKRLQILPLQLIDTLGIISNSMRAGFSFMQAMQLAGKEMPDPLGPEFERAVREAGLGIPLEKVFEDMSKRLPNKELEVVLQAITAQRKSGGNLAQLLETMEDTIRGRVRILGEMKTLTSQGRMSSWVITLLPVGLGLYLHFINPDYFSDMIHHPIGIGMLVIAGTSVLIGWFLIQKIIQIEV